MTIFQVRIITLTPQGQSSERNLPETIVPWRSFFDKNDKPNHKKIFEIFKKD